ncbi:hypothetical protein FRX31_032700 [Thalictrum thalictroides]|uniref:Retrovirus-related Pol polyprotein from transposon TNT 1-94-like beta-barrel domain-containing protein n=1 Tax=Thalictrum thalictroides TaxID=46969 RepID=A0A7J6UYH7_THATH|nr:hypothetical protein FRX31_032700 [Thalictrum thalictroides]
MSTSEIISSMKNAPKLSRPTFKRWSKLFELCLTGLGSEKFILEDVSELSKNSLKSQGSTEDSKSLESRKLSNKCDSMVKAAILQLVPEEIFYLIEDKLTAKNMWDTLLHHYQPCCAADINSLLQDFWTFTMDEETDIDEIVFELNRRQSAIASLDPSQRPSDSAKKNRLLGHFDNYSSGYYSGAVTVLRLDETVQFDAAVTSLRASQDSYKQTHLSNHINLAQESKSGQPPKKKKCAYCHRSNHIRETCFLWIDTPDGSKWAAKNPEKAAKVRKLKEKYGNPLKENKSSSPDNCEQDGAWVIEDVSYSQINSNYSTIILDTGATHHIFCDKSFFTSISPIKKSVQTATGQILSIGGIGSVRFRIFDIEGRNLSKFVELDDVWYLPSCTRNLVSGFQLHSDGYLISSNHLGLSVVSRTGDIVATARPENGLFCFNTSSNETSLYQDHSNLPLSPDIARSSPTTNSQPDLFPSPKYHTTPLPSLASPGFRRPKESILPSPFLLTHLHDKRKSSDHDYKFQNPLVHTHRPRTSCLG